MGVIQRVVKPTKRRTARILQEKAPKIIENTKQTIFIRGRKVHDEVLSCMKNFAQFKKPHCLTLNKKHDITPFDDFSTIEKLSRKHDCSLFAFASHNKKRPNNLTIGRLFDCKLLDMFELGVDSYIKCDNMNKVAPSIGIKPVLSFIGEEFDTDIELKRLKSLLVDLFHQNESIVVHVKNVEYVLSFMYIDKKLLLRTYRIQMKNVGEKSPRVELLNMCPNIDFSLRRKILASEDLLKKSMKKPKTQGKKIKNIRRDPFNSKLGRVHMTSQDVQKLQTRKMKGLRKTSQEKRNQKRQNPCSSA